MLIGYGGMAGTAAAFAKLLFVGFLIVGAVTLVLGVGRRGVVK